MKYNHLTINERACIYQFKQMGQSIRKIAKAIDRSPSTISRELKRNSYKTSINYSVTRYSPITAQNKYEIRRTNYHKKCFFNEEIKNYIDSKIQLHWSPDQIVERYGKNKPNLPSISAASTGFISLFNPTLNQLNELASYMWSDLFQIDGWKKLCADPMDAILGLSIVPVAVPSGGTREVKVGNIGTGISLTVASSQFVEVDCG